MDLIRASMEVGLGRKKIPLLRSISCKLTRPEVTMTLVAGHSERTV